MKVLVTGAAGFIGSHLAEALLARDDEVVGVDAFIPYYPRAIKERNLADARAHDRFTFHEADLRTADLAPLLDGVEVVFHIAAMGGLLLSWTDFSLYMTCNILATQRLLDAARAAGSVRQVLYASTSSIYGADVTGPETTTPHPVSPYGITKLAAEHLVQTYDRQFGLPSTVLRYYSVYGPRQRPDMGYYIFVDRILHAQPITIFGDGTQLRGNTYVERRRPGDDPGTGALPARRRLQHRRCRGGERERGDRPAGGDHRQAGHPPLGPGAPGRAVAHAGRHDARRTRSRLRAADAAARRAGRAGGLAARSAARLGRRRPPLSPPRAPPVSPTSPHLSHRVHILPREPQPSFARLKHVMARPLGGGLRSDRGASWAKGDGRWKTRNLRLCSSRARWIS